jgi:hypothetical protein
MHVLEKSDCGEIKGTAYLLQHFLGDRYRVPLSPKVSGLHYAERSRGKPTFINFDKPYPNQDFTLMIWDDDRPGFGNLGKYAGHQVCARGVITEYHGKPEMVVHDPSSVTMTEK